MTDPAFVTEDNPQGYTGEVRNFKKGGGIDPVTGFRRVEDTAAAKYDPQTGMVSTKGMSMKNKMKYSGLTTRSIRNGALGSAVLGNADKGIGGINNSMGAKMAVGMGMSALSQRMPEEAQGAMALGGMVGQFNPLAGIAVGLGGAALNSKTAAGGAMTGAGAGAAIGTMIAPGIGTAVGAALGAITGAIAGFAGGMRQRAKEAKNAMGAFLDGIATSQFVNSQDAIVRQEKDSAAGLDMSGRSGAMEGIAGKTAAKYKKLSDTLKDRKFGGKYSTETGESAMDGAKGGALAGMTAGAGVGAIIGTAIPIPAIGTLTGALIGGAIGLVGGALVGGVGGAIKGWLGGSKRKKQQAKDFSILEGITKDPAFKGLISDDEMKSIKKDKGAALTKLRKDLPEKLKAADAINDQQGKRREMLKKMSGTSGAELEILAKKRGVNLYDSTMKMTDMVDKLGLAMVKTKEEMKNLNTDSFIQGISDGFDEAIKAANAPKIYDERGRQVFDVIKGGGDTASVLEAVRGFQEASMGMGEGAIDSFYGQKEQLGTLADPGKLFQANGAFAKMDPADFFTPEVVKALAKQDASTEKGFIGGASEQITGMLANSGMMGNSSQISAVIQSMDAPNRERFLKDVESGSFNITDPFANLSDEESKKKYEAAGVTSKEAYMQKTLSDKFGQYGASQKNFEVGAIDKDTNAVADKMDGASETFKTAVQNFNDNMASYFTDSAGKPDWWSKEAMEEIMGDTSSPRGGIVGDTTSSRLSQTMARHSAINGSISGKRSITSSYRTNSLGSLNSDHVTGRAIDLVGQNLGSYAVATRNAGGFAEFHGSGAVRHLHAVPGPGAIGDTLTPVSNQMGGATSATVTSGSNSFTFHINGGQNNPEEIASMVMAKIQNSEQRIRERS